MASGSQVCKMNWPDLLITAVISDSEATNKMRWLMPPSLARVLILMVSKVWPAPKYKMIIPHNRPMSPAVGDEGLEEQELGFSSHQ